MNLDAPNRLLDEAEDALESASGGRYQAEVSFIQGLLCGLGADVSLIGLSPVELLSAIRGNGPLARDARNVLEILALPLQRPVDSLRSGDWLLRAVPGTGDVGHVSVLASNDLLTPSTLTSEGIAAESTQPGYYGIVIEAGAFPHSRAQPFARRLLDGRGRVPPHTVIVRPKYPQAAALADIPPDEPELDSERASGAADGLEESITVDDVASEMNGLRCRFLSAHRATRADGSARGFSAGALLLIGDWNGVGAEATVDGFTVPKLVLAPAPDSVSGMRRYDVALDAQRTAVGRNARELAAWVARESEYRSNHGLWERERARLQTLLDRRQATYSRMWVRQMMYNRFDFSIAWWVRHYNTQLSPATVLDANIVKSLLYQESRMGTSGEHLMPPPSDWASGDRHPIRSRFNIGQAIDSWGPQQWLMMREMAPSIFARHDLSTLDRTWMSTSNDDYNAHAPFRTALRDFFEFRDGSNRNLMGTTGRYLHEDYGFWIRTAIRWLFVKYANLSSPTWPEAVRAYNGGGARARAYRDAVMARVGSSDPYAAESLETPPNGAAEADDVAIFPRSQGIWEAGAAVPPDAIAEAERPKPGRIYEFVRDLLKLPRTDTGGFKKIIDSRFHPKTVVCRKGDSPSAEKKCSYSALIVGEWTHNNKGEQDLALEMMDHVAGIFRSGSFALREETSGTGGSSLGPGILTGGASAAAAAKVTKRRGITVAGLPDGDQFHSERWVPALVKGANLLITYTGSAHTSKEYYDHFKKALPRVFDMSAGKPILDAVRDANRRGLVLVINLADEILEDFETQAYREKLREFPDEFTFKNWCAAFQYDWGELFSSFASTTIYKLAGDVYWALVPPYSGLKFNKLMETVWSDSRVRNKLRKDRSWTLHDIFKNRVRFEDDHKKGKHFFTAEADSEHKKLVGPPAEENY